MATGGGDRDIASYGVVRMLDETRWEPKKVFHAMAARYERNLAGPDPESTHRRC
jgi:hypothetical protein